MRERDPVELPVVRNECRLWTRRSLTMALTDSEDFVAESAPSDAEGTPRRKWVLTPIRSVQTSNYGGVPTVTSWSG